MAADSLTRNGLVQNVTAKMQACNQLPPPVGFVTSSWRLDCSKDVTSIELYERKT